MRVEFMTAAREFCLVWSEVRVPVISSALHVQARLVAAPGPCLANCNVPVALQAPNAASYVGLFQADNGRENNNSCAVEEMVLWEGIYGNY